MEESEEEKSSNNRAHLKRGRIAKGYFRRSGKEKGKILIVVFSTDIGSYGIRAFREVKWIRDEWRRVVASNES